MKKLYLGIVLVIFLICIFLTYKYLIKDKKENIIDEQEEKATIVKTTTKKEEKMLDGVSINYHASIRIEKDNKVVYFDPFKIENTLKDADYVFITHSHYDHYSEDSLKNVIKDSTKFIITSDLETKISGLGISKDNITVVYPNEHFVIDDLKFDTIPSYNTNKTYHKKSYNWVGYNLNLSGVRYYVVGDSDITDEIKEVNCDVMFVPVGGTYTMTDIEAANVVNEIKPKYAVPIHYDEAGSKSNAENFIKLLNKDIEGVILR